MPRSKHVARISAMAWLLAMALALATPPAHAVPPATSAAAAGNAVAPAPAVLPAASAAAAGYDAKCQFRAARRVGNNWHISEGGGNLNRGDDEEVCQIGNAQLKMQHDGNLVLYNNGIAVWDTETWSTWPQPAAYRAEFQTDGNFVVYNYNPPTARWASNTWSTCGGSARCELVIQSDGNVVIYNGNQVVWDAW